MYLNLRISGVSINERKGELNPTFIVLSLLSIFFCEIRAVQIERNLRSPQSNLIDGYFIYNFIIFLYLYKISDDE